MRFAHLHVHNEYSVLDGLGTAKQYAERASQMGFKYLGLSNHGNIDGLLQWQEACEEQGIQPVLGCEMYVVDDALVKEKGDKRNHITLFVKNKKGFKNLCVLLNYANLEGFYYNPRIDWKLLYKHLGGLVALTGCVDSVLQSPSVRGLKVLRELAHILQGDLYFEVMPHNVLLQKQLNETIRHLQHDYAVELVATNDCHYVLSSDYKVQEVLLAIQRKAKWTDKDRFRFKIKNLHLRSEKQMRAAFEKQAILSSSEISQALANSIEVAKKCSKFRIEKKVVSLPKISVPDGWGEDEYLWQLCQDGLKSKGYKGAKYKDRLKEEMALIVKKGFVRYFLIVDDLINYCKKNNIMVGPGRGSVGGSLIADLIGITTGVDPLKYDLLFSRFIAEDRGDYPDIDLDFEDTKRDQVRSYLEDKYGESRVVGITTALRMKTRNALRDVSRVFEVPSIEVSVMSKAIASAAFRQGVDESIESVSETREGERFKRKYPQVIEYAKALEGQVRAYGQHAAAIVLSPVDLTRGTRGHLVQRKNNLLINWDMHDAEKLGFLKIDILGLNTLTVLNEVKRLVGGELDFEAIDLEDEKLFEMINEGRTTGLFQVQTPFMTGICKEIGIEQFSHVCDAIALARPGPHDSGMTDSYIHRKETGKWRKKNKIYEEITASTFGVIVYQEQVMAVLSKLGGMSYSYADKIRKIIGKKRGVKYFEEYKAAFIKGCEKQKTLNKREALEFWSGLEKHAHYSFNRAHSVSYAMITMWTAYCKHYHTSEFICASLTYMGDKPEQKNALLNEAVRLGLEVVLPKVAHSHSHEWLVKGNKLYVPFIEVKGIGDKTAAKIKQQKRAAKEGFFNLEEQQFEPKTKVEKLLVAVGAYSEAEERPEGASKLFDFDLVGDFTERSPKLVELYGGDIFPPDQQAALTARFYKKGVIVKASYFEGEEVKHCKACKLRRLCKRPVACERGRWNIAIIGEAPGRLEDKRGRPFVGKAGERLWKELKKYGLNRAMFHISNVNKCFPDWAGRKTAPPDKDQIIACSQWLNKELAGIDCRLVLALGNNPLFFFTGQQGGIRKASGEVVWNDSRGLWTVFAVHPSSVLRARSQNLEYFEKGIEKFAEICKRFLRKRSLS